MTGNLKAKVEVALRDPKMKFLIVLKVDAVLQYEWKYLQMYDAFPIHLWGKMFDISQWCLVTTSHL